MTPTEKAKELVKIYMFWKFQTCKFTKKQAKQCASVLVDKILESDPNKAYNDDNYEKNKLGVDIEYWQEVKKKSKKYDIKRNNSST